MADFDGVSYIGSLQHVHCDGLLAARLSSVLDVRAQLDEEEARLPGRGATAGDLGQASNLL